MPITKSIQQKLKLVPMQPGGNQFIVARTKEMEASNADNGCAGTQNGVPAALRSTFLILTITLPPLALAGAIGYGMYKLIEK